MRERSIVQRKEPESEGRYDGTRCMVPENAGGPHRTWFDSERVSADTTPRRNTIRFSEAIFGELSNFAEAPLRTPEAIKLERTIRKLEARIQSQQVVTQDNAEALEAIHADRERLLKQKNLRHLLDRVCDSAQSVLLTENSLLSKFESTSLEDAFVMSIDIRRSTELMLKAREPQLFADFITSLCMQLGAIIVDNLGVFDKFTGDGILAFFPTFFSGEDAGYRVVQVAEECHEAFRRHYVANRKCFTAILKDTGLGIGIDFGKVRLVRVRGELTVVGTPVVYSCRLGGADAGDTLLNQPAYERIFEKYSAYCRFDEASLQLKHEGEVVAYRVKLNDKEHQAAQAPWQAFADENQSNN
jgi:class 3 adenylate cyclase